MTTATIGSPCTGTMVTFGLLVLSAAGVGSAMLAIALNSSYLANRGCVRA
jgi:hypothetical protein